MTLNEFIQRSKTWVENKIIFSEVSKDACLINISKEYYQGKIDAYRLVLKELDKTAEWIHVQHAK